MRLAIMGILALATSGLVACVSDPAEETRKTGTAVPQDRPSAQLTAKTSLASAPLDKGRTLTWIAFGSCLKQEDDQLIWNTVAASDPDLFLFIGDNVYGDNYSDAYGLPELKEAYATLAASAPFEAFRKTTPVLPVWDDHDYGYNDKGANFQQRYLAEQIFEDVWALPQDDPRRTRDGVYHALMVGEEEGKRVQIILLDTRFFRSDLRPTDERGAPGKERYLPDPDPAKTMLGDDQWVWLKGELQKPADLRIIASSIQVIAEGHGWEAWRTLPLEREKLYDTIGAAGAENVVLISGDRHAGALYRNELRLPYPLYEITSSSLNAPASIWRTQNNETRMEDGPNRLGDMYYEVNFGIIEIDWATETIDLQLKDQAGMTVRNQLIPLDDLRPVY